MAHCLSRSDLSGKELAVEIKNGYKSFGKNRDPILADFSLTIHKGSVYTLLGSSGCGKTTVLSTLVGLSSLDKGKLLISGKSISQSSCAIGYMPQEISLYREFSVLETLVYFGILFGVRSTDLRRKIDTLSKLLCLPPKCKSVGRLSGGQQKRVSLAVALIHDPELLILDEPTSGLDPLIRIKIWEHLNLLAKFNGVTVLVTTHYTDEAKYADTVGVMRDGKLVMQENPEILLNRYCTSSMDQVVLQLYKAVDNDPSRAHVPTSETYLNSHQNNNNGKEGRNSNFFKSSTRRIKALVWKNGVTMFRNLALLCFVLVMPAVITLITCTTFRSDPHHLPISIVNQEVDNEYCYQVAGNDACLMEPLSCKFLEKLRLSDKIQASIYTSIETATQSIKLGNSFGVLVFPKNFSTAFVNRSLSGMVADEDMWNMSKITMHVDQTNTLIYSTLTSTLYAVLERFSQRILKECGIDPKVGAFPLQYQQPLVGSINLGVLDYVAPGFSFAWLFFFPLISTSIRLIGEKRQGTLARTLTGGGARGTQLWEILISYVITEAVVIFIQSTLTYSIMTSVFNVGGDVEGTTTFSSSSFLILSMFIFGGFSGLCCGFLLGLLCGEEIQAAMLAIAIFFPNSFISGLVWPLEGMPLVLQYISPFLPFTLPSEALRSLINRGWEFGHPSVWPGFVVVTLYTFLYVLLILMFLMFFRSKIFK